MATEISIPVKLQIQNLQSLVTELQSKLSNLKVGSSGFKTIQNIISTIRGEIDKLSIQTAKPFVDAGQFTKAEHSVDKLEESIEKVQLAMSRLKFSDLELTNDQKADIKAFEDSINSIKEKLRVVKSTAKDEFLNSAMGKEWLKIDETAFSKSLAQITNNIRSAVRDQNNELNKLEQAATSYQRALTENERIKEFINKNNGNPLSEANLGDMYDKIFMTTKNNQFRYTANGRNLLYDWLESQLHLDDSVISQIINKNVSANNVGAKLKEVLNNQIQINQNTVDSNPNITAKVDEASAKYQQFIEILHQVGASEQQVAAAEQVLRSALSETANNFNEYKNKLVQAAQNNDNFRSTTSQMQSQLDSLRSTLSTANGEFIRMQRTQQSFNQMKMAIVNFMGFRQVLNLTKNAIRDAINHIRELDTVMNKISIVTDMSTGDLWSQVDAYSKMAQTFGVSIKGAYEVSQIYYQQGLQTNDVLTLTNETLKLAKISGLDYATTTDFMTTAIRGFKMEMSDASRVVDVYSNLASHTAVSQEELAVAMSKTASSMEAVGATFEESSAMIGTMVAVTRESATNIGSAMKSIASRYGELTKDPTKLVDEDGEAMAFNKVDAALQSVGISMKTVDGQFRNFTDVIIELGEKWNELDSTQQRYIATQFAGNRQQSRFLALVSNVDMLKSNLDVAMNSEDTGTLQALKALDSIEAKTEQVRVAYQQFYTTIGAENIWKGFLDGATNVINTLNSLPKLFGKIPIGAIAAITSIITLIKSLGMDLLNAFAQTFGQSMVQGALQAQGQAAEGAQSLIGIVLNTIKGRKGEFVAAGQESAQAYSQGMKQESTTLTPDKLTGQNKVLYNQKTATISALTKYDALHTTDGVAVGMAREALQAGLITQAQHDSLAGTTDGAAARVASFVTQLKQEVAALFETSEAAEQSEGKLKNFIKSHKNLSQGLQSFGSALNMVAMTINTTAEGGKTWSGVLQGMAAAATLAGVAVKVLDGGLKAMPWMALASGVLMAINAISTLIVTPEERLEELTKKAEELSNKAKEEKANYRTLENSSKKLDELTEKRYESAEAAEEYQTAVDDLTSKFPELILSFDDAGNAILDEVRLTDILTEARQKSASAALEAAQAELERSKAALQSNLNNSGGIYKLQDEAYKYNERNEILNKFSNNSELNWLRNNYYTATGSQLSDDIFSTSSVQSTITNLFGMIYGSTAYQIKDKSLLDNVDFLEEIEEYYDDTDLSKLINYLSNKINSGNYTEQHQALYDLLTQVFPSEDDSKIVENYKARFDAQIEAYNTALNDYKTDQTDQNLSALNEAYTEFKTTLDEASETGIQGLEYYITTYTDQLKRVAGDVGNLTTSSAALKTASKDVINKTIGDKYSSKTFITDNSGLTSIVTDILDKERGTADAEEWLKTNSKRVAEVVNAADSLWQSVIDQYDTDGELVSANLTKMLNAPGRYSADTIISYLQNAGITIDKTLEDYLIQRSKDNSDEIVGQLTSHIAQLYGHNNFSLGTLKEFIEEQSTEEYGGHDFTTYDRSYFTSVANQISSLEKQGFDSTQFENNAEKLYTSLYSDVSDGTRVVLFDAINKNKLNTEESIQKIIDTAVNNGISLDSDLITSLQNLQSLIVTNIKLSAEAAIDNFKQNWGDTSKSLKKLTSGVDFIEKEDMLTMAKSFGDILLSDGTKFTLDDSDFKANGDKLSLTAEKAQEYWEAYALYMQNQSNNWTNKLDEATARLSGWNIKLLSEADKIFDESNIEELKDITDKNIEDLRILLGGDFNKYITTTGDEVVGYSYDWKEDVNIPEVLNEAYKTNQKYITEYLQYIGYAKDQIIKSTQWANGDYSSLESIYTNDALVKLSQDTNKIYSNYMERIADLAAGARYTDWELEQPDIKSAVESYTSGYSTLLQDIIDKGADKINTHAYSGIDAESAAQLIANGASTTDIVLAFAKKAGYDLEETNEAIVAAIQSDKTKLHESSDIISDLTFLNKDTFTASLDALAELATNFNVSVLDLIDISTYNKELKQYIVNMPAASLIGINLDKVEGIQETIKNAVDTMLDNSIKSLKNAFSGKLAGKDLKQLKFDLKSFGIELDESQFQETAEGFKISNSYATELYHTIQSINAIQGQVLFTELSKNLQESDEHYTSIAANTARIAELQDKINRIKAPTQQLTAGNVDLVSHAEHVITAEQMQNAGWGNFGDDYATLYSRTFTGADWEDINTNVVVNVTPITNDGTTILSPDDLDAYVTDLMSKSSNAEEIKLNDTKKLVMNAWDVDVSDAKALANGIADAEKEAERLHEESEAIVNNLDQMDQVSMARINQYEEELALAKEIKATRSTTEDSSFNFMDNSVPSSFSNPANFYSSMFEARDTLQKALSDTSTGISYDDFYNMVTTFNDIAGKAGTTFEIAGMELNGDASTAANYITNAFKTLSDVSNDGTLKVSFDKLGLDLTSSADSLDKNIDAMIDAIAEDQIDMLNGMISLLEVIVAMENLGDIDVDSDLTLDLGEIFQLNADDSFKLNDEGVIQYTQAYKDAANKILELAESSTELSDALTQVKVGEYTAKDLLEDAKDGLYNLNISAEAYTAVMNAFYKASISGDYNLDDIFQSIKDVLASSGFEGEITIGDYKLTYHAGVMLTSDKEGNYIVNGKSFGKDQDKAAQAIKSSSIDTLSSAVRKVTNEDTSTTYTFSSGISVKVACAIDGDGNVQYTATLPSGKVITATSEEGIQLGLAAELQLKGGEVTNELEGANNEVSYTIKQNAEANVETIVTYNTKTGKVTYKETNDKGEVIEREATQEETQQVIKAYQEVTATKEIQTGEVKFSSSDINVNTEGANVKINTDNKLSVDTLTISPNEINIETADGINSIDVSKLSAIGEGTLDLGECTFSLTENGTVKITNNGVEIAQIPVNDLAGTGILSSCEFTYNPTENNLIVKNSSGEVIGTIPIPNNPEGTGVLSSCKFTYDPNANTIKVTDSNGNALPDIPVGNAQGIGTLTNCTFTYSADTNSITITNSDGSILDSIPLPQGLMGEGDLSGCTITYDSNSQNITIKSSDGSVIETIPLPSGLTGTGTITDAQLTYDPTNGTYTWTTVPGGISPIPLHDEWLTGVGTLTAGNCTITLDSNGLTIGTGENKVTIPVDIPDGLLQAEHTLTSNDCTISLSTDGSLVVQTENGEKYKVTIPSDSLMAVADILKVTGQWANGENYDIQSLLPDGALDFGEVEGTITVTKVTPEISDQQQTAVDIAGSLGTNNLDSLIKDLGGSYSLWTGSYRVSQLENNDNGKTIKTYVSSLQELVNSGKTLSAVDLSNLDKLSSIGDYFTIDDQSLSSVIATITAMNTALEETTSVDQYTQMLESISSISTTNIEVLATQLDTIYNTLLNLSTISWETIISNLNSLSLSFNSTIQSPEVTVENNSTTESTMTVDADTSLVQEKVDQANKDIEKQTPTETIDGDNTEAIAKGQNAKDQIDAMVAIITINAEGDALGTVQSVLTTLQSMNGQTYSTTLNATVNSTEGSKATGNLGLAKAGGTLMGELGPELVVSNGRYFVAGQNGPEFVNLNDDAIVFNHLQTQSLLKNGTSSTRGRAITNERNAVSFATGNVTGPAMASASAALATLKELRSMWESLLSSSVSDLAGTGGSGGGGSDDDSTSARNSYLVDVERWYNWLQKIAVLEEKINTEEAKRSKYQADMVARGAEYAKSNLQTLKDLQSEAVTYQALANTQQEFFNLRRSQLNGSAFSRFYTFDENGQLKYNDSDLGYKFLAELMARDDYGEAKYSAEQQYNMLVGAGMEAYMKYDSSGTEILMDEDSEDQSSFYSSSVQAFWDLVDSQKEEMQSLHDSIVEYGDSVIEKQTAAYEIMKEIEDNQIAVEDRVLAAIEDTRQREIDELQDQRDAIEDAANSLIDGLSNQLQKEQDMYANQDSADELSKLQRQLGILQRSGGSASQIASLQKEITQKQREAYFDAQQEQIDALKEASDNEIERLDRQIELMTESLEYEKENGLLWNAVYEVMAGTPEEITDFITKHDSQYWGESPTKLTQDTRDILFEAGQFVTYRENVTNGIDELVSHFTDEAIQQGATEEAANSSGGGGSTGNGGGNRSGGSDDEDDSSGSNSGSSASGTTSSSTSNNSISNAVQAVKNTASTVGLALSKAFTPKNEWASPDNKVKSQTTKSQAEAYEWLSSGKRIISKFDEGGMIDEDQFAFVHAKESVLTPEQTSILRNDILSNKPTSLLSLLTDFRDAYTNISGESAYNTVNNSNGVTIEQAVVEMHVSKIANDYDAQRAGEQALEKMVQIARKTQGQNRVGR